jgi:hypothetical protein
MDVRRVTASPAFPILVIAGCAWVLFEMTLFSKGRSDYVIEAQPAFLALQHGHFATFLDRAPAYGGSLLLRAPLLLLPGAGEAGHGALFRLLSIPGLLALTAFGLVFWSEALAAGTRRNAAWAALLLGSFNLLAIPGLQTGHSEELLAAVACASAGLLVARRRQAVLGGILLGLAIACKPWAVVAVPPLLMMLQSHRPRFLVAVFGAAGLVLAPFLLRNGQSVGLTADVARTSGTIFKPWQLWWFLGHHEAGQVYRVPPSWLSSLSHPAIVLAPLAMLAARPRLLRRRPWHEGLLLLAVVLLVRCLLDTWDNSYYLIPAVLVLGLWEINACRRAPRLAWAITAVAFLFESVLRTAVPGDVQAVIFLLWMVPVTGLLALRLLAPARFRVLRAALPVGRVRLAETAAAQA